MCEINWQNLTPVGHWFSVNYRTSLKINLSRPDLSPTFLNTGNTSNNLENKTPSDKSSGSQFFRTTTGIQSGPDAFDKSRLVLNFLTNLRVTEKLCNFRLVLEGKTGKEIPESSRLEYLEKCFSNYFSLSNAEYNISRPLNRGVTADLPFLRTLLAIRQKSQERSFWEVIDSFVL